MAADLLSCGGDHNAMQWNPRSNRRGDHGWSCRLARVVRRRHPGVLPCPEPDLRRRDMATRRLHTRGSPEASRSLSFDDAPSSRWPGPLGEPAIVLTSERKRLRVSRRELGGVSFLSVTAFS